MAANRSWQVNGGKISLIKLGGFVVDRGAVEAGTNLKADRMTAELRHIMWERFDYHG